MNRKNTQRLDLEGSRAAVGDLNHDVAVDVKALEMQKTLQLVTYVPFFMHRKNSIVLPTSGAIYRQTSRASTSRSSLRPSSPFEQKQVTQALRLAESGAALPSPDSITQSVMTTTV